MKKPVLLFIASPFIFLTATGLYAQSMDTLQIISKIRRQYEQITRQQIENMKVDVIDNSYIPTNEEMEEAPFADIETFDIYSHSTDTLLIRRYKMNDEGGAFSHAMQEVAFWDNEPFFYYEKTYTSWEQVLFETRYYIDHGQVIRKLTKESSVAWNELPMNFYDLQSDNPNQNSAIAPNDFKDVIYFIATSKEKLKELTKQ